MNGAHLHWHRALWPSDSRALCGKLEGGRDAETAGLLGHVVGQGSGREGAPGKEVPSPRRFARHFRKDLGSISTLCSLHRGEEKDRSPRASRLQGETKTQ